jgi:TPR repeat protein
LYETGLGVSQNYVKAKEYYLRALEMGHLDAYAKLANLYEYGKGVTLSKNKAYEYYIAAARKGHIGSQFKVSTMYKQGVGTEKDLEKSKYWLDQIELGRQ